MPDEEDSIFPFIILLGLLLFFFMPRQTGIRQTGIRQTTGLVRRDAMRPDWRPNPGGNVLTNPGGLLSRTITRVGRPLAPGEGRISDLVRRPPRGYR